MSESVNAGASGGQKREPDPQAPEFEFEVAQSHLTGVLGTRLGSSGKAVHTVNSSLQP